VGCEIAGCCVISSILKLMKLRDLWSVVCSVDLTTMESLGCREGRSICASDRVSGVSFVNNGAFSLTSNSITVQFSSALALACNLLYESVVSVGTGVI
jgi:hypothetical protein